MSRGSESSGEMLKVQALITETKAVPSPTIATGGGNGGGKTSAQQLKMP